MPTVHYLKEEKTEEALAVLKKMVNHDTAERTKYKHGMKIHMPLLCDTKNCYFTISPDIKHKIIDKLNDPDFDEIRKCDEFLKLVQVVNLD